MHSKKELDIRLQKAGVQPLKRLGQNFLVNGPICDRIVGETLRHHPKTVVEIGPGLGALTDELITKTDGKFVMVEFDSGLVKFWEEFKLEKSLDFHIIHKDALRMDWAEEKYEAPASLVSNLPYSIAASMVMELSPLPVFDSMVLMFQKEVAERIMSTYQSDDYGLLSVVAQNFWNIQKLIDAGPQDFHPVPNVGSRVLSFQRKTTGLPKRPEKFIGFVKLAFSQRRKKLISNLRGGFEKEILIEIFSKLKIADAARAQDLTSEMFRDLHDSLGSL